VLLVFGAPCQLRLLAGQEHGRTIPLADMRRRLTRSLKVDRASAPSMPGGPQSRFSCFGCRHPVAPTHFCPRRCRRRPIVSAAGQAMPFHGDLATDHGAAAVYTEANKAFGGIDILINNAGAYEACPWICS